MPDNTDLKSLHLPSLFVDGFRGIDYLKINQLGRVTLLAGRNGVGKTTVLDAVRVFAAGGQLVSLMRMLARSEEVAQSSEDSNVEESLDFEALFYGRNAVLGSRFLIGSNGEDESTVCVEVSSLDEPTQRHLPGSRRSISMPEGPGLKVSFGSFEQEWPVFEGEIDMNYVRWADRQRARRGPREDASPRTINCQSIGPGLLKNEDLDALWGEVALTPSESLALNALQLGSNFDIDGVAVVPGASRPYNRRVVVRMNSGQRVPLRSLGDGATRLFSVAVALANAADGFLLIDEAENGIHHGLQAAFWRLVLRASREHNVQVVATTHSWDCIAGFSAAANEDETVEGVVVRLERNGDGIRAVEYSEEELATAALHNIEVR